MRFQVKISQKLQAKKLRYKYIPIEQSMFLQKMYSLIALTILVFPINHFKLVVSGYSPIISEI